jgi:hypothetical protein
MGGDAIKKFNHFLAYMEIEWGGIRKLRPSTEG